MTGVTQRNVTRSARLGLPNSLRFRVAALLAIAIAVALTVVISALMGARQRAVVWATNDALAVVDTAAKEYGALLEGSRQLLSALAQIPSVANASEECSTVLEGIDRTPERYTGLFVISKEGLTACPLEDGRVFDHSARRHFQQAVATGDFAVGEYQIGRRSGKPNVIAALPVYGEQRTLVSVVAAGIDLSYLADVSKLLPLTNGASFLLIDPSQQVLVGDERFWQTGEALPAGKLKTALEQYKRGFIELAGPGGRPYLFSFTPIVEGEPVMAVVAQARSDIIAPFVRPLERTAYTIALLGAFVLGFFWWLARHFLLRPLERLLDVTQGVGAGQLSVRAGSDFPDELKPLAEHLDRMTISLEQRQNERDQAELERERYARNLERSNKDLEQFAYVASHDLQEPLRMVSSYVQLLERRYADKLDDKAKDFIGFAVDGTKRMRMLIDDLLRLSRVATKGAAFKAVATGDIVDEVLVNLCVSIKEKNAVVTTDDLPEVMGDETQLFQLFQNLIGNAIKFRSEADPRVHIGVEDDGERWAFSVSDNGIGIEPKFRERIFEIFQRLHTRDAYEGTGIGLALCRKIVERHGGRIFADDNDAGGTTFQFTLPKV